MENVTETIRLLRDRRDRRAQRFFKMEEEQITEYNALMARIQITKDETFNYKENITRNLQFLTTNKNLLRKLFQDSESIPSLPISHNNHGEAMALFTQGTEFINETNKIYEILGSRDDSGTSKEEQTDPVTLLQSIISSVDAAGTELNRIKSTIAQAGTLNTNISVLQEHCIVNNGK